MFRESVAFFPQPVSKKGSDVAVIRLETVETDELRDYRELTDVVLRRL
jgi:hypothetical protein